MRYQEAGGLRADLKRLKRDLESGQAGISRIRIGSGVPTISSGPGPSPTPPTNLPFRRDPNRNGPGWKTWLDFRSRRSPDRVVAATMYFLERGARSVESQTAPAQPPTVPLQPPTAPASAPADNRPAEEDAARARSARMDAAVANVRARLAAGDINGAASALEAARAIDPAAPAVLELTRLVNQFRTQADAARRAAELLRQAPTPPPQRQATRGSPPPERPGGSAAKRPHPPPPPQATQAPEVSAPTTSPAPPLPAPAPVEPAPRPTPPPPAPSLRSPVGKRLPRPPQQRTAMMRRQSGASSPLMPAPSRPKIWRSSDR